MALRQQITGLRTGSGSRSRSFRLTLTAVAIVLICLCQTLGADRACATDQGANQASPKRVLILNSYHAGMPFSDDEVRGIRETLTPGTEIFVEYMDTKRRHDASYLEILAQAYQLKYTGKQFDTILSLDDDALNFLFTHADRIFPEIPVVFCGVDDFRPKRLAEHERFTGVIQTMDIQPSLKTGLALYPRAQQILVITDRSTTGASNRASLERIAASGTLKIPMRFLDDGHGLDLPDLLLKLKAETAPSLVYYSDFFRDKHGHTLDVETVMPQVTEAAPGPVLVHSGIYMGHGALGGKIVSGYYQGATAAQMAMRIWNGEDPARIPVIFEDVNKLTLDFQVLRRWDIDLAKVSVPEEIVIVNRPEPLLGGYGFYLLAALVFIIAQSALLLLLLKLLRQQRLLREEGRQREALLGSILESAPVPLSYARKDGRVLAVNSALTRELGYTLDDVPTVEEWMQTALPDPEERRKAMERWGNASGSGAKGQQEYRLTAKDGSVRDMLVRATRQGTYFIVSFFDISERKQQEEELIRSRIELEDSRTNLVLALDMANMGSWELDLDTMTFTFNEQFYRLYATTLEREGGALMAAETYAHQFIHPDESRLVATEVRRTLAGEYDGRTASIEHRIVRRDGAIRDIVVRFLVATDHEGRRRKTIGVNQDITERKRTEEALLLAKHAAEAANRAKSEFLANMSHEIRTPLNGVLGMLQLIQTSQDTTEVEMYAEMGIRAGKRLTSLLGDILDLSRIEAGRMPLTSKPFALDSILSSLTETFSPMNFSKSLPLVISAAPDLPAEVVGDEVRVRQILFNLVGNAMKFTDQGEVRVDVSTLLAHPSGMARLLFMVSDTGLGIPDEKIDQICAPFTQVSQDLTRSHQGAGLGLAIAHKLIRAMGGTLTFESTEGQGTCAYLVLPFIVPEPSATREPEPTFDVASQASLRLLLVEDDDICRLSARSLFQKLGHHVVTANNGQEALEALRRNSFDCVFMDVQMDTLDGVEATRRIRSGEAGVLDPRIPIIALTSFAMSGDREKFIDAGMDDYIAKPVQFEELRKGLARVAEKLGTGGGQ